MAASLRPILFLASWLGVLSVASAAAFEVDARTEAQAYEIRAYRQGDPTTPTLLPRRRVVQYLGLNAYELVTGADLGFESNLRVFTDFGLLDSEASHLDGLRTRDADLLYANVHYRGHGFEAQLGRQIYGDGIDVLSFDGVRVRYLRPLSVLSVGAEVYGGLWTKGAGFLSSSVYQPDGVRETDVRRLQQAGDVRDPSLLLQPGLDAPSPVFGGKLLFQNLFGLSGGLGYRKSTVLSQTDFERATVDLRYGHGLGVNGWGSLEYDLFQRTLSQARLSLRYDQPYWAASVEAMRLHPTFSASSIWYYFAFAPRNEVRVRGDLTPTGPVRFYAQALASLYSTPINENLASSAFVDSPGSTSAGGSVGAALWHFSHVRGAIDVTYRQGYGGTQLWGDLTTGYLGDEGRWSLDGRLSVANVADAYNPLLRGTFYGAQAWGSFSVSRAARLSVAIEENVNPFTRSDTKVFFLFDLKATL